MSIRGTSSEFGRLGPSSHFADPVLRNSLVYHLFVQLQALPSWALMAPQKAGELTSAGPLPKECELTEEELDWSVDADEDCSITSLTPRSVQAHRCTRIGLLLHPTRSRSTARAQARTSISQFALVRRVPVLISSRACPSLASCRFAWHLAGQQRLVPYCFTTQRAARLHSGDPLASTGACSSSFCHTPLGTSAHSHHLPSHSKTYQSIITVHI